MSLRLFDTYTRSLRDFVPLRTPQVRCVCLRANRVRLTHTWGICVRTSSKTSCAVRWSSTTYRVTHVMNLTDVGHLVSDADTGEDKMEKGTRRTGKSAGRSPSPTHRPSRTICAPERSLADDLV